MELSRTVYYFFQTEQQIDGETMLGSTERMVNKLFPTIKQQVIFLKDLERLKRTSSVE